MEEIKLENARLVENIKLLSKEKGFSLSQIERQMGLSSGLISRWKFMSPAFDKILEVSRILDVPIGDLLSDDKIHLLGNSNEGKNVFNKLYELTKNNEIEWEEAHNSEALRQYINDWVNEQDFAYKFLLCQYPPLNFWLALKFDAYTRDIPTDFKFVVTSQQEKNVKVLDVEQDDLVKLWWHIYHNRIKLSDSTNIENLLNDFADGKFDKTQVVQRFHDLA